ncbi:hypothetical protein MSG28_001906 [Choristoneura fumiferana]|uniref:Uncharacterized protein n=1 Tax=Choristoneura fumiferana TaxID=7141 RepID=A0ACC0JT70_CHOFU|nr:hypothetical protein MSG28_001906 [Choristoneura fumiferana]
MPKRKHDIDYYIKKLKSIEKSLKRKRLEAVSEPEDTSTSFQDHTDEENDESGAQTILEAETVGDTPPPTSVTVDMVESIAEVPTTSPDVLQALGDLMPEKPSYGPPINSDLARIWSTILKNGIQKESKDKLIDKLMPENCILLKAPKLNPEIAASISDNIVNRDKKIEMEQNQLGIG